MNAQKTITSAIQYLGMLVCLVMLPNQEKDEPRVNYSSSSTLAFPESEDWCIKYGIENHLWGLLYIPTYNLGEKIDDMAPR